MTLICAPIKHAPISQVSMMGKAVSSAQDLPNVASILIL